MGVLGRGNKGSTSYSNRGHNSSSSNARRGSVSSSAVVASSALGIGGSSAVDTMLDHSPSRSMASGVFGGFGKGGAFDRLF